MSPRGLDHVVVAVRDLDRAAERWQRLGFRVGAENRHPFGTKNRIVQTPGFFVELLAIDDSAKIPPHAPGRFSFAAFNRDFLDRVGEGASMLVLESRDADADVGVFRSAGIGGFERFDFARSGRRPDGAETHVAFRLAFAVTPAAPDIGFFACQQLFPENFWNPALQSHANGVSNIAGAAIVAEEPEALRGFLEAFTGASARHEAGGLAIETPRGTIAALTPAAFADRYGVRTASPSPRLRALRFHAEIARVEAALGAGDVPYRSHAGALLVDADCASGALLVFEAL